MAACAHPHYLTGLSPPSCPQDHTAAFAFCRCGRRDTGAAGRPPPLSRFAGGSGSPFSGRGGEVERASSLESALNRCPVARHYLPVVKGPSPLPLAHFFSSSFVIHKASRACFPFPQAIARSARDTGHWFWYFTHLTRNGQIQNQTGDTLCTYYTKLSHIKHNLLSGLM